MLPKTASWSCGAVALLASAALCACGHADGIRYTVDGAATFATTATPPSDATVRFTTLWHDSGGALAVGGSKTAISESPATPVGAWSPTSNPAVFTFEVVVEVERPSDGSDPGSAMDVTLARSGATATALGSISSQQVGDEQDGWYSGQLTATFNCTHW